MAQWVDYFRIVQPKPSKTHYMTDDILQPSQGIARSNYSWYSHVMSGEANRLQKYVRFHAMSTDVIVARGLDTVAEEMATQNSKTGLPFDIIYLNDDNNEIEESVVMTVKTALRHWSELQDLYQRIFRISREVIMFGDCFFRKSSDHKRWAYVNPRDVLGIEVDDYLNPVFYHVRKMEYGDNRIDKEELEIIPAEGMIHFSLSDGMGDAAPFGDSVLTPVQRAFKQKQLIEDATIIYRIVRAPERRVFYVDTGNMHPGKTKAYLEEVKNDVNQKRMPSLSGGADDIDALYNPTSMVEDYFLAATGNGRGTRIETLPGGASLGDNAELDYFRDQVLFAMRIPSSYMKSAANNGYQFNDGKTGVAYMEEAKFANFVRRLQSKLQPIFDEEFKTYLENSGIKVDTSIFRIELPEPQNFTLYRQAALDAELVNVFNALEPVKYLSKRFLLKRYLGLTEDDVQSNEALLRQERDVPEPDDPEDDFDLRMFYDPAYYDNAEPVDKASLTGEGESASTSGGNFGSEAPPGEEPPPELDI